MSRLGDLYAGLYAALCGHHPHLLPWHYQWLPTRAVNTGMRRAAAHIAPQARVLDVGCGTSPYRSWLPAGCEYTGLDIPGSGGNPDIVVNPDESWPLADASFDVVMCNQVLEHVVEPALTLAEIRRVLRPGGILLLSVPFIYCEHGMPYDFRRFTAGGLGMLLADGYEIRETHRLGGVGTVLAAMLLNWAHESIVRCPTLRYAQPVLLPLWLAFSAANNFSGFLLDMLDRTDNFYQDVMIVAVRKS
jgi:SAM-dependent methyltransferase